jgi:hypothetical protein
MSPREISLMECTDYQPIQAIKNSAAADLEIAEDAGCDSCVHYKKGQCEVYVK